MEKVDIVKKYGMPGNVDSATILQTVKDLACNSVDPQGLLEIVWDAELLDALLRFRCRLEYLQEQRFPGPRLPNSSEPLPKPMDTVPLDPDRSWGIVVGINDYQASPLHGCVSDTLDSHIQPLLVPCSGPAPDTPLPSRANIIEGLHSLRRNPLIQKGDNIIIYFSGHGASYRYSDYFPRQEGGTAHNGAVEAICPADRTVDINGHPLIPDIKRVKISQSSPIVVTQVVSPAACQALSNMGPPETYLQSPLLASGLELMLRTGDENLREYYMPGTVSILAENWSPMKASHFAREAQKDDGTVNEIFTEALMILYHGLCCTVSAMTPFQTPIAIGENSNKLFPWHPQV
ncbi:hypothetical protein EDD85DRAFT_841921 [Armillaria nabsnona]|nr:hypothetical protein EDD85DRAFT_841921 [Armillaria nabsnona]